MIYIYLFYIYALIIYNILTSRDTEKSSDYWYLYFVSNILEINILCLTEKETLTFTSQIH